MKAQGFTLIELVVVIVILGILAATAIPKLVDLDTDAKKAVVSGAKAALQGAAVLTYAKSTAQNLGKPSYASIVGNASIDSAVTLANSACVVTLTYAATPSITATADLTDYCQ